MHGLTGERVLMRIHIGEREGILPELDEMIGGGLITLERARVIVYRPDQPTR
jgi:hypothetical protein